MFDRFRKELHRHRQRPFLEPVAAACALVGTADGKVSFSERARLDAVVESLYELQLFDPQEVVNSFDEHVVTLAADEHRIIDQIGAALGFDSDAVAAAFDALAE